MAKIVWAKLAIEDLRSLHDYISQDSKVYADRFIDKLIFESWPTGEISQSGRIVPEFNTEVIRELIEGNYRIIYRINLDHVGIVRIHHAARPLKGF